VPKPFELRKVINRLKGFGIVFVAGKGRHPKFFDPETNNKFFLKGKRNIPPL
jgi:hypothetical protein